MKSVVSTTLLVAFVALFVGRDSRPASGVVRICEVLRDYYVYADTREPVLDGRGQPVWAGPAYRGDCMELPKKPNNWPIKDEYGYSGGMERELDQAKLRTQCSDCNFNARNAVAEMEENHNQCIDSATAIAERKCANGYEIGEPRGNPVPREEVKCDVYSGVFWCKINSDRWKSCLKGWLNGSSEAVNGGSLDASISAGDFATLTYNGEQRSVTFGVQNGMGQWCNQWQSAEFGGINQDLTRCVRNVNVQSIKAHVDYRCKAQPVAQ